MSEIDMANGGGVFAAHLNWCVFFFVDKSIVLFILHNIRARDTSYYVLYICSHVCEVECEESESGCFIGNLQFFPSRRVLNSFQWVDMSFLSNRMFM